LLSAIDRNRVRDQSESLSAFARIRSLGSLEIAKASRQGRCLGF